MTWHMDGRILSEAAGRYYNLIAMSIVAFKPAILGQPAIPPLKNGDHLKKDEFLRRYDAMPSLNKAELIQGRVYVASPVNARDHGEPHAVVVAVLVLYTANT